METNSTLSENIARLRRDRYYESVDFPRVGESIGWLVLFVFAYFAGAALYFWLVGLANVLLRLFIEAESTQALTAPLLQGATGAAGIYFVQFCLLTPMLLRASHFDSQPWRETLNLKPFTLKSLGFWLFILTVFFLAHTAFCSIFGLAPSEYLDSLNSKKNLFAALTSIALAPVLEELLFRGYLFKAWRRSKLGLTGTLVLTSILFTAGHWTQWHWKLLVPIFVLSIILGLAREKTGSIWIPIILHSACNLQSTIISYLPA